ncbi:MAG: hypothetical protein IT542_08495 [Rubellimicrobium sp.]|nr:hypothetical protein [Rubellimicrobium sp.]
MLGILLFSMVAMFALGGIFGLIDPHEAEDRIDDSDIDDLVPLLDHSALDAMEQSLATDPDAVQDLLADGKDLLAPYEGVDYGGPEGTEGDDFITLPPVEGAASFGMGGNDVILGSDVDDVIMGGAGNDLIFGRGTGGSLGYNQLFGDAGDDTIVGGDGADFIVGGDGADLHYGGGGDDHLLDHSFGDTISPDVFSAGSGDDVVQIRGGVNRVSLGEGADILAISNDDPGNGDNPMAVVTDFDPDEDALILMVHVPQGAAAAALLGDGREISFTLDTVQTSMGAGTLVAPATDDPELADLLSQGSIGHAVLIGLQPGDLSNLTIRVVAQNGAGPWAGPLTETGMIREMGGTLH